MQYIMIDITNLSNCIFFAMLGILFHVLTDKYFGSIHIYDLFPLFLFFLSKLALSCLT